ncbi:MAG TPA: DUF1460 domain-containing protein [Syntrophorhabdaceae bacterium]|nr:DUF1460 domain-containing protein [Syntrophorhabdaceae bacterium]
MHIVLGRWTEYAMDEIIKKARAIDNPGERVDFISGFFLNTSYKEHTLIGSKDTKEELTADLSAVDCFTFIDYVEAMRLSGSYSDFLEKLQRIRYRNKDVSFVCRNHFFTDWIENNYDFVDDVTSIIGKQRTKSIKKFLNEKEDGSLFLEGIQIKERNINYINIEDLRPIKNRLKTGDYTGIYTSTPGLDVSHVGIIIKRENKLLFRHASSRPHVRMVIDEDLEQYLEDKEGIIVLRPKPFDF